MTRPSRHRATGDGAATLIDRRGPGASTCR
jgi:hypothetical protein